jgi:hypothetical protein
MADPTPLLDLSTVITRPFVRIDGVAYDMVSPDELSVIDYARISAQGKRIGEIEELGAEATDEQKQEYERLLDTVCRRVLLAPDEIHRKLTTQHRCAVAVTFTALRLTTSLEAAGATQEAELARALAAVNASAPTTGASEAAS